MADDSNQSAAYEWISKLRDRGIVRYDDTSFLDAVPHAGQLVLNSYSGVDITCSVVMPRPQGYEEYLRKKGIDPKTQDVPAMRTWAELETLSVSSARSVWPVRRLGEDHVHEYTRGARTIAGSMVFTTFSRDVFADFYRIHPGENFFADGGKAPFFVDQIPPFHILIQAANEYGSIASAALINVHLSNFGTTFSIHDLKTESTYTYVAQFLFPFVSDYQAFQDIVLQGVMGREQPLSSQITGVNSQYQMNYMGHPMPPRFRDENGNRENAAMERWIQEQYGTDRV